jgi:Ribonuclease G/E
MVMVHPDVAARFYDEERAPLERVEERLQARIMIKGETSLHLEQYEISPFES